VQIGSQIQFVDLGIKQVGYGGIGSGGFGIWPLFRTLWLKDRVTGNWLGLQPGPLTIESPSGMIADTDAGCFGGYSVHPKGVIWVRPVRTTARTSASK
jgi:hypothetical protein